MFGWFRTRKVHLPRPIRRPSLRVELLEERNCPTAAPFPENVAPVISSLTATCIGGHIAIEGYVQDETPELVNVNLTWRQGEGGSATVTPDASGYFYHVTDWNTGDTEVLANAVDNHDLSAEAVTAAIATPTDANPFVVIDDVIYGERRQITVVGRVFDENPLACTVYFTGAAEGTTSVNYDGAFAVTLIANSLGTLTAYTQDEAQQLSNSPIFTLTSEPPRIINFGVVEEPDGWYTFFGEVIDESPFGLLVYFGGEPISLQGDWASVEADGWFYRGIRLNGTVSDEGVATVQVWDWWGLASEIAMCYVHQTGVS